MKDTNRLTIKEALDQGYEYYGFHSHEWQTLNELHEDLRRELEEEGRSIEDVRLFGKEVECPKISSKELADVVSDYIGDQDSDICMRDDDRVYETVLEVDFTDIADHINNKLQQHSYRMLTDIGLKS